MRTTRTIYRAAAASLLAGGLALTAVSGTAMAAPASTSNGAGVAAARPAPTPNNWQFTRD